MIRYRIVRYRGDFGAILYIPQILNSHYEWEALWYGVEFQNFLTASSLEEAKEQIKAYHRDIIGDTVSSDAVVWERNLD